MAVSRSTPSTTTSFWRLRAPATIRTSRMAEPSSFARSRTRAWLAAPSTAGALTRTWRTPSTTPSTRAWAERGVRRTANRTAGAVKTSQRAHQDAEDDQDEEAGPIDHAGRREDPADRGEDRLGCLEQEGRCLAAPARVDPRDQHPSEHEDPDRDQQELDEVEEEGAGHMHSV